MCIQFVYLNNSPSSNGYRLVVVNNRDEHYNRPTKPAAFWGKNNLCISGLDQFPGREGGTWFGVSKAGKVGALLNILTPQGPHAEKQGRGHLVCDYIQGPVGAATYIADLEEKSSTFNPFNLVLIEKSEGTSEWTGYYYSNSPDFDSSPAVVLKDGVHGFSNSVHSRPFCKVEQGRARLAEIMSRYGTVGDRSQLHCALFELMSDKTCTLPDSQLMAQGGVALQGPLGEQRSGIYVDSSQIGYGTRTTTILTVTADGRAEYVEKTMCEPVDPLAPVWTTKAHQFTFTTTHSTL